jgi:hypothetical protein
MFDRLYPLKPHAVQQALNTSSARFRVVPAGRRSGKTERAKRYIVRKAYEAVNETRWPDSRFFAGAPTRDQAKAIFWSDLKAMIKPEFMQGTPSESTLTIKLIWGAEIVVVGMDKPQRIEGRPWDGGVLDEFANMKPAAWQENVRPALSDRMGWAWLIGVPEGRNHYYELHKYALSGEDPSWATFTWPSSDILDPKEIEAAKRELDDLVFDQEYNASFINFEGRVYYPFLEATHTSTKLTYDAHQPLDFSFDFNVAPGVAVVSQEQRMPGEYERDVKTGVQLLDQPVEGTGVIGEVYIPRNSNTPAVCRRLIADWGEHQGTVHCYGDATGGATGSAKVLGSDWDLIKAALQEHYGGRVYFHVPEANPRERARVNAFNSRLRSATGTIHLMIDAAKAPHLVTDLEGVRVLEGGAGEIDKVSDPSLTHISDALGYRIVKDFPIAGRYASTTAFRG